MDLSIIIVNYNTNQLTCNCIESIHRETKHLKYEIIVVDNASQREDPNLIRERYPNTKLIINNVNEGFGRANNTGIKNAQGNYILLLNSDTVVIDSAINKCFNFMESDLAVGQNIGLLGCTLLNSDFTFQHSIFGKENIHHYLTRGNPILNKISSYLTNEDGVDLTKIQLVSAISGAFMFFRSEVFKKIAPFDPDIFMYSEETELCRRRVSRYYNIIYWPGANILHHGSKSGEKEVMYCQNMLSYALTWYKKSTSHYLLYILYSMMNSLLLVLSYPLVRRTSKKEIATVLRGYVKIFPYVLFEIPKYERGWGSRKEPLKLKNLS